MDTFLVSNTSLLFPTAVEAANLPSSNIRNLNHDSQHVETRWDGGSTVTFNVSCTCNNRSESHTWRIDGRSDATRFFALPDFARSTPPLRIDVYMPQLTSWCSGGTLEDLHDLSTRACTAGDISNHAIDNLVCILSQWSATLEDFRHVYQELPYGSYIVVEQCGSQDSQHMEISMVPDFATESAWLSWDVLQEMWQLSPDNLPDILDWTQLQLQTQPHDTISLVTLCGDDPKHCDKLFVYKSVLRDLQHFYHELKILLTMPPHPNIISKPRYIVVKPARFGGRRGVCGMVLDFHAGGSLHDRLLHPPRDSPYHIRWCLSVAKQITSALMHIRRSIGSYTNIKPHNIVLTSKAERGDPILIDFEQRSGWWSWSAPEIYYVNYLEHFVGQSKDDSRREHCRQLLQEYMPTWAQLSMKSLYDNPANGYAAPWSALDQIERNSAQVFMLGKLLWCIFEETHSMSSCLTPESILEPAGSLAFPTFSKTPELLRTCIRRCTAGAPEWDGHWPAVIKKGEYVHKFGDPESDPANIAGIQQAAKNWWCDQIQQAERFVRARSRIRNLQEQASDEDRRTVAFMYDRPSLEDVLEILTKVEMNLPEEEE